jgi:hypothetical protein
MRAWTLDDQWNLNFDKKVSDGGEKPVGRLVAYPVTALFVRNVKFKSDDVANMMNYISKQNEVGASVGYGPFSIGGSYQSGNEQRNIKSHVSGSELIIEGLQLIGFINNLIPKSPDTNPAIRPEQFVGGA